MASDIRISEAYPNGGKVAGGPANDYIELTNNGTGPEDISGWVLRDDKDSDNFVIDSGTVIPAGGRVEIQVGDSKHAGNYGLGNPADAARLYLADGTTLVDQMYWNAANASMGNGFSRCASTSGVMDVVDVPVTPGAANDCPTPAEVTTDIQSHLKVNEIEANGSPDWIELYNSGPATLDLSGYYFSDNRASDRDVQPAGTYIAPSNWFSYSPTFGLGKSGDDAAIVFPNDVDVDRYSWNTSMNEIARCPDGSDNWATPTTLTPGAANVCDGSTPPPGGDGGTGLTAQAWPGPQDVTTADDTDFGQNMSGLFYVPGATPAQDYMWGVENGDSGSPLNTGQSSLFKLVQDASGNWGPATGWEKGVKLHYPDGSGQPDSEGVTAVGGKAFISTERDNSNNNVSRVSILEYDPSRIADGALNATTEWDLEPDFNLASGDANAGFEAVTFIPDSYLVANGFKTDAGALYDPSQYGDHFGGVFVAGLEKDGSLYAYVLQADGAFQRLAAFSSGFSQIMDAAWDPSQEALWLDCDNGCDGQTSIVKLDTTAGDTNQGHFQVTTVYNRPTGGANINNEGFTVQPPSECDPASNTRSVWWSDDADDAGHAIRTAKADCNTPIAGQVGATVTVSYTQQDTATPAVTNASGAYTTPVTANFLCTNQDAVLQQPCPAPVDVTATQAATTVASLTDTLGNVYTVALPAITINSYATWSPSEVYNTGDTVGYQGKLFRASWWTQNQTPGNPYGPWQEIATTEDGTPVWTASRIFEAGDIAVYRGRTYQAKWYTRNQTPGDPYGPWTAIG
ncbi:lamin tail domain-containing protein [Peterkaempfera sp. SMS 1(5)a]|uniref:lamin tail domain-containing protein n=1 Tax=Peterkaempfera podocarpi TaxID=3232308 RepID=UPI00367005A4